jgi:NADPH2:quinone reductase
MRRILVRQHGGPEVMQIDESPTPKPGPSEILVRIRAAGVNPVDTYIRMGVHARKPQLPYVPGFDGAGEVEAVGSDIKKIKPGNRVYIASDNVAMAGVGTYSDYALCRPTEVHPLPDRVSFAQGAAIGVPYATVIRAFTRAGAKPGDTILVHGATGGVGLGCVQMGYAHGMFVIGTGGTERGLQTVRENGADVVLNHHDANYLDGVMQATEGRGVDIVLEMAAHLNLDKDLGVLAKGGRVISIGSRGRVEIDPRGTMGREADIRGILLFNLGQPELSSIHAAIVAGLRSGIFNPIVGREMPLADAPKAHEAVLAPGALGKIVLMC